MKEFRAKAAPESPPPQAPPPPPQAAPQAPPQPSPPPPPAAEPQREASASPGVFSPLVGLIYLGLDLALVLGAKQAIVHYLISIPVAAVVYFDCRRRRVPELGWTIAVAVLGGFAFVFYPFSRRKSGAPIENESAGDTSAAIRDAQQSAVAAARQAGDALRGAAEQVRQRAAERAQSQPPPKTGTGTAKAKPAPATPSPQAASGERPYLHELIRYLWGEETTPKPLYKTWAHGVVVDDFDVPREELMRPYTMPRAPYGRIVVWPGWLVFMTESHNTPGRLPAGTKWISLFLDHYRESRRYASYFRMLKATHAHFTKEQRDIFQRPLANPNSIILPLSQVRNFHQERVGLGSARLLVQTRDGRELLFGVNGYLELGPSMWKMAWGGIGTWHPKLQRILRKAAEQNKEE